MAGQTRQRKSKKMLNKFNGEDSINESTNRIDKFYDSVAKVLLDETEYKIEEKNYGTTVRSVNIEFPMYPWTSYKYTQWDMQKWSQFDGYLISQLDLDFVINQFSVNVDSAKIIMEKYIKLLSSEILEKMG